MTFGKFSRDVRCSRPDVFLEKGVLEICSKFTGEHPCRSAIAIKLQNKFKGVVCRGRRN